jgi:NAD(P)-dependent dehydrogenase (short-subunit alcohol dehydrogenase family)
MPELAGKSALVTGGAGRFGFVAARLLASEGAAIALADVGDPARLDRLAGELRESGAPAIAVTADVTREEDCRRMVERVEEAFGALDIALVNAGVGGPVARIWETAAEDWRHTVEINLTGAFLTAKHAALAMIPRRAGKIIFVSSRDGLRAEPYTGAYNAAKHGVHGLMKTLAIELGPYDINVNAVCPTSMGSMGEPSASSSLWYELMTGKPGATEADFDAWAGKQNLFERAGRVTPEEVAEGVLWLASERSRLVTGHALPLDAGWIAKRGG